MDLEEKADVPLRFSRTEAVCQPLNAVTVVTTDRLEWILELGGAFTLPFPFPHRWELLLLRLLLDRCACTSLRFLSSPEIRASGSASARLPCPSYVTAFTQSLSEGVPLHRVDPPHPTIIPIITLVCLLTNYSSLMSIWQLYFTLELGFTNRASQTTPKTLWIFIKWTLLNLYALNINFSVH